MGAEPGPNWLQAVTLTIRLTGNLEMRVEGNTYIDQCSVIGHPSVTKQPEKVVIIKRSFFSPSNSFSTLSC